MWRAIGPNLCQQRFTIEVRQASLWNLALQTKVEAICRKNCLKVIRKRIFKDYRINGRSKI